MINEPVAPKTTRSYVRPCCLNPISSTYGVAAEIYQVKYVVSVKMPSVCMYLGIGLLELGERNGIN